MGLCHNRGLNWLIPAFSKGKTLNVHLTNIPYSNSTWSKAYPALQFILNDDHGAPKGNIITGNIVVGDTKERIAREISKYGLVDSNFYAKELSEAQKFIKARGIEFINKENVGVNVHKTGIYKNIKFGFRQPLLPILQKKVISSDKIEFIFAQTSYLDKMKVTLRQKSKHSYLRMIYRSPASDTIIFKSAPGKLIMRARYTNIEGVLNTDFIEEHIKVTSQLTNR